MILGDQLNLNNVALENFDATKDLILMVEASAEAAHVWSHKARIALFFSAMRHYADTITEKGFRVKYLKIGAHDFDSLNTAWQFHIHQFKPKKIIVCEPGEYRLEQELIKLAKEANTPLVIVDDVHFMCSKADFKRWAGPTKTLRMEFFYREMRKKHNVLMQDNKPVGGAWNYDADNRKAFGKKGPEHLPKVPAIAPDHITQQAIADVQKYFPDHPGSLSNFIWPVTRKDALVFLKDFIAHRLNGFGEHQDAMWQFDNEAASPYLWHSLLSTSLNLKLLNPREVIAAAEEAYQKHHLSLASVEGFIRQVLGWREFIRGVYWLDMPSMGLANHYKYQRKLPSWYWNGETHMNCQRQAIQQTLLHGYAHHIQRLMVTGMFGILAEINPREVEAWYLAVYVDALEWVELPNVAGMALYANGGRFTSKPYIASGAYIKRMSNYCSNCKYKPELKTGADACPVTTLYWNFLFKHQETFSRNPRTALMANNADRFNKEEVHAIQQYAEKILSDLNSI